MYEELLAKIRDVPDFPEKGIIFKDITTLLQDNKSFCQVVDVIGDRYIDKNIEAIVCIEARGFILGAAIAYKLGKGLVLARKPGKLPYKTISASYELEYGTNTLEMHVDSIHNNQRVVIVDDLLATGGTVKATCGLVEQLGGNVEEVAFLIELSFLEGKKKLNGYNVFSLLVV